MKAPRLNKTTLCLFTLLAASQQGVAAELIYPANAAIVNDSAQAKQFLLDYFQDQPETVISDISARYQRTSLTATHYNFDVIDSQGKNCHKALVLSVDKEQKVQRVYAQLEALSGQCDGTIEKPRTNFDITKPVIPTPTKTVHVAAQVYNPDPRTMNQEPIPTDGDFDNYTLPKNYTTVTMPVLCSVSANPQCVLANDKVMAIDIVNLPDGETAKAEQQPQQGLLTFSPNDLAKIDVTQTPSANKSAVNNYFYDVMAFYHLDNSLHYVESLGFNDLFNQPVQFDAQGSNENNSKYLSDMNLLSFGMGGSPDTLDADVILHEFGHTINYFIVPDWAYGDTSGIGEGFGDYWAGMSTYRTQHQQGTNFELDTVFNFDGHFGGKSGGTRSLNDEAARYYPSAEYQAHISVNGTLSDQLWSTPIFQSLKEAVAIYDVDAFNAMNRIIIEGLYGLGRGTKMHHAAQSILDAAQNLYPNHEYGAILRRHFNHHNLLPTELILAPAPQFIDTTLATTANIATSNGQVSAVIYNPTTRDMALSGQLTVSGQSGSQDLASIDKPSSLKAGKSQTVNFPLNARPQCGQRIDLTLDAALSFDNKQRMQQASFDQSFVFGLPNFAEAPKTLNQAVIDAKKGTSPLQPMRKGLTYATYFNTGEQEHVGDDLAIITHISHPDHRELKVTLIAPDGQQVILHDHQAYYQNNKQTVYRLADHPQLKPLLGGRMTGAWRLEISDIAVGNSGQLIDFGVTHIQNYQCKASPSKPDPKPQPKPNNNSGGGGSALWLTLLAMLQLGYTKAKSAKRRSFKR
ncbi:proprotein convertase P-domain-containing protein [Photobacterium sanguinicancri]|uniref:proprotein convertase P-domain-containing protein n=1 Tax=Photobacterium sanguinicancri TaxID=875932 RepID=UPI0021C2FE69|nr:proprotein convertase P-domain-containing protein [Photobacterium sanguinicancri]